MSVIRDSLFLEDHLKELNAALTNRDKTIEDLKRRLMEQDAKGIRPEKPKKGTRRPDEADRIEASLIKRENQDLKDELGEFGEKEKELLEEIRRLKQQNSDLSEVLNPLKQDKNKFYQKFFEQEKKIENLENKVTSLMDDNFNLKRILEKKNEGGRNQTISTSASRSRKPSMCSKRRTRI